MSISGVALGFKTCVKVISENNHGYECHISLSCKVVIVFNSVYNKTQFTMFIGSNDRIVFGFCFSTRPMSN